MRIVFLLRLAQVPGLQLALPLPDFRIRGYHSVVPSANKNRAMSTMSNSKLVLAHLSSLVPPPPPHTRDSTMPNACASELSYEAGSPPNGIYLPKIVYLFLRA